MTTSQAHEHRIDVRVDLETTIFIEILASESGTAGNIVMCHSLDLSSSGLQVVVDDEIPSESIFRLCVDLSDDEPIFLVAEVKWVRPDPDSDSFRIGFLLFESEGTDIERWKAFIQRATQPE